MYRPKAVPTMLRKNAAVKENRAPIAQPIQPPAVNPINVSSLPIVPPSPWHSKGSDLERAGEPGNDVSRLARHGRLLGRSERSTQWFNDPNTTAAVHRHTF